MREIGEQFGPCPADAIWAERDAADLVAKMRHVAENKDDRLKGAAEGKRRIAKLYGSSLASSRLEERFDELRIFTPQPRRSRPVLAGVNYTCSQRANDPVSFSVRDTPPDLLVKCTGSALAQTHFRRKLVLQDDGSTPEDTRSTLANYRDRDSRIKVCFGSGKAGLSAARNAAVADLRGRKPQHFYVPCGT